MLDDVETRGDVQRTRREIRTQTHLHRTTDGTKHNVQRGTGRTRDRSDGSDSGRQSGKWTNKERVLVFSSRGINFRTRHLMQDLKTMMPHSKAVHTLAELKMTGNCLKGSRPLLSFDPKFDKEPHYALLKELFTQIFSTPRYHPKSQPFVDHVLTFTIADNRVWFRNYQIIEEDASLVEIGPRFVLNLIKIFQGSFGGPTLYENPHFQSPNMQRRMIRQAMAAKQKERQMVKEIRKEKRKEEHEVLTQDVTDDVFATPAEPKEPPVELEPPEPRSTKKKLRLTELKKRTQMKRKGLR
ncbi:ribosome biogenesis BRX1-like protein [Labeo rohita]|uniref:Ribosome biogenesis protein BRX1 homolog n=1 Tax=Labeo rohita TaxID=84645 RepID=A0A498MD24_LABRO|nr:ribosome biogenesis BRX1-like protein [Labeo rohita]RXN18861.1 ribosome biogenesis BRX1-like protein [Labeo rohita]